MLRSKEEVAYMPIFVSVSMEKIYDQTLKNIADKYLSWYDSFDSAHNRQHVDEVRLVARMLAKKYYDPDKLELVELAAILHDVGLKLGRENHELNGVTVLKEDKDLQAALTPEDYKELLHAVGEHRSSTGKPKTTLAKIIADADRTPKNLKQYILRCVRYSLHVHNTKVPTDDTFRQIADYIVWKYTLTPKLFIPMSVDYDYTDARKRGFGRNSNFPETLRILDATFKPVVGAWINKNLSKIKTLAGYK
jgi:HD superfamily phosphodiesterase